MKCEQLHNMVVIKYATTKLASSNKSYIRKMQRQQDNKWEVEGKKEMFVGNISQLCCECGARFNLTLSNSHFQQEKNN